MTPSATALWTSVLDEYARSLDDALAYLRAVGSNGADGPPPPPAPFTPPVALPPLPDSLAGRAAALEARTRELQAMASDDMDRVRPDPARRPITRQSPAAAPRGGGRRAFDGRL